MSFVLLTLGRGAISEEPLRLCVFLMWAAEFLVYRGFEKVCPT